MILYNILIQEYCSSIATAFFFSVFEGGYEPKKTSKVLKTHAKLSYMF